MRLDMTKELRLMREDLKQAITVSVNNTATLSTALSNMPAPASDTKIESVPSKVPLFGKSAPMFQSA